MMIHLASLIAPFIPSSAELRPIAVELCLTGTIVAVLLAAMFKGKSNLQAAIISMIGCSVALVALIAFGVPATAQFFHGAMHVDPLAVIWRGMLMLFMIGIIWMFIATRLASLHDGDGPEFFSQLLGAAIGLSIMGATQNLLMIFVAVEMASLPSYILASARKGHPAAAEAGLKYVVFGAATAAILAYGLSLLYGLFGTLHLAEITAQLHTGTVPSLSLTLVALLCVGVGIAFKIAAAPIHLWCPDVFEGATVDVAAFLSVASKGAGILLLARVLHALAGTDLPVNAIAWTVGAIGAVTATLGNVAALRQENLQRLFAYSSIAQAGYLLCVAALLPILPAAGLLAAILVYLIVYLFMNLAAFSVIGVIQRQGDGQRIDDLNALGRRAPVLAIAMTAAVASLVGLPPFAGFIAKFNLLYVLTAGGVLGWTLVVVIGVNTVISLFYYGRILRAMYLVKDDRDRLDWWPGGTSLAGVCAIMLLVLFVFYNPLQRLAERYGSVGGIGVSVRR